MRWLGGFIKLNEHEFEQFQEIVADRGSLLCGSPWGHMELGMRN